MKWLEEEWADKVDFVICERLSIYFQSNLPYLR